MPNYNNGRHGHLYRAIATVSSSMHGHKKLWSSNHDMETQLGVHAMTAREQQEHKRQVID